MLAKNTHLSSTDIQNITTIISPILGMKVWDVMLGYGSFVTAEFGSPIKPTERSNYLRGEWHLWVKHSFWRLEENGSVLVASEDNRKELANYLKTISGLNLDAFDINPITFEVNLLFGNKSKLSIIPTSYLQDEYEYWALYTPVRKVLLAGPGMQYRYIDSSREADQTTSS
jgi:hypothetical protein